MTSRPPRRRIAYVFPQGDLGGAEIATLAIIRAHDRTRYESVAFALEGGPILTRLSDAGILVESAPERPRLAHHRGRREGRRWIADMTGRHHITVLHSVMAWTHALVGPAAKACGVPEVWFQHTPARPTGALDWYAALAPTHHIVVNSLFTARRQHRMNPRRFPVTVVRPPVPVTAGIDAGHDVRADLGGSEDDVLAVVPGRLHRPKGHEVALRAFARARRETPALRLAIVGDEAFGLDRGYRSALARLADDLGVGDAVAMAGFRRDMPAVYAASDLVLVPSLEPEGYGMVVAEALAARKVVVASGVGAIPELIRNGVNGRLLPPGDVARWADTLAALAADPGERERLSAGAQEMRLPDARDAARRLETLYDAVLK